MEKEFKSSGIKNPLLGGRGAGHLLSLLHLSDPALPIGGFSHSAGLETYVQLNIVYDKTTATAFITEMLSRSIFYTDAAIVSLVYEAANDNDLKKIKQLDEECTAVKLPMEMRQASQKLGNKVDENILPCI